MTNVIEKSHLYKEAYAAWTGNPEGNRPDYARCCQAVWSRDRWSKGDQCVRKRGYGPDGAYCKQHDPAAVKARNEAKKTHYNAKWNATRYEMHGRTFFNALVKIAEGHNDARGLAQEVIDIFKKGEM